MSAIPAGLPAPGGKSAEAFRTISEVAFDLDVPQHVLRFWESRFAQVKPVKRAGGRRYYRPEDVDLLRGIRSLLYADGFTIKGVQKVLRERGLRHVAEIGRGEAVYARNIDNRPLADDAAEVWQAEAKHARAVMADLARAHAGPQIGPAQSELTEEQRTKLEILLAELLQMKAKLRAAAGR